MSCYCDADPADVWNEKRRKARKNHVCSECGETIEPKEEYTYISCLSDGDWGTFKLCEYCEHDWEVLVKAGHCQLIGGLEEAWRYHWEK